MFSAAFRSSSHCFSSLLGCALSFYHLDPILVVFTACEYVTMMTSTWVVYRMLCLQFHLCMELWVASTCDARVYQSLLPMHRVQHRTHRMCAFIGGRSRQHRWDRKPKMHTTIAHRSWAIRFVEQQLVSASHISYHDQKFYRWSIGWFSISRRPNSTQIFDALFVTNFDY